jgi:hypothetical protein
MKIESIPRTAALIVLAALALGAARNDGVTTVKGYVLDSACAFTKNLAKPISRECAISCAKAGSPLVILAEDGTVYWPISDSTPAAGQNERLLSFAAKKVIVRGKVFTRGGSHAIVIAKIEPASPN